MTDRKILILYGSQTGTAVDVAERIWREGKRFYFNTKISSMDDYPIANLIYERLVVFVVSTTGQGEEPDNMKSFWRFLLRKSLPSNSLSLMKYAVLGLGDSSYEQFNFVAKRLHKRMQQLGGDPVQNLGLADDQNDLGPDAVVFPWIKSLWENILLIYPLPDGLQIITDNILLPPKYGVTFIPGDSDTWIKSKETVSITNINKNNPFYSKIISNERITSCNHFQDVRLIKFDISGSGMVHKPGDVVMIQPQNLPDVVDDFLAFMKLDGKRQFLLKANDQDIHLPPKSILCQPCTIRECVEKLWNITCTPRRSFFELLSCFANTELEKEKLIELSSSEGQEELFSYCNRPRRTLLEVLQDFPNASLNVPFEYFFNLLPNIQPRPFSIASSLIANPNEIHIIMAVVSYKTKLYKPRFGLCSSWLASLSYKQEHTYVPVWIRKGTIHFPQNISTPVIMVGPGTGCAPFRGFIQERTTTGIGNNILFFGCRNEGGDFFFSNEWIPLVAKNLLNLYTAFSRDQENKIYVQHRIIEQKDLVWKLINKNAWFYIAGNAKQMPLDVTRALLTIFENEGQMSPDQANLYLKQLKMKSFFQTETWS